MEKDFQKSESIPNFLTKTQLTYLRDLVGTKFIFWFLFWNLQQTLTKALHAVTEKQFQNLNSSSLQMKLFSALNLNIKQMAFSSSFLIWFFVTFSIAFPHYSMVDAFVGTYGVNYGRLADNIPAPESVVTLLKAARIKNVRIYDSDHSVLQAFKGSGIEIIIGLNNGLVKDVGGSEDRALTWVKENVEAFVPGTKIRGVAVGNEILGSGDEALMEALLPAVKNVYNALERLNLAKQVEVSSPHSAAVFADSYPPSDGVFKDTVLPYMKPLLQFFSQIHSPFYMNIYPFLAYVSDPVTIDIKYALFKKNKGVYDAKSKLHYDNMFDAQIDAAYAALEKAGFGKTEVIVSETGWASRGDANEVGASVKNAQTYNGNLRKRLLKRKGTPSRPKTPVKAYVFALFNENQKPGPTSERNFGLFKADGRIAYDIGFTGLVPSSASSSFISIKGNGLQSLLGSSLSLMIFASCSLAVLLFM